MKIVEKWKLWLNPTPLQVVTTQLREAEINLLRVKANAEYSKAMAQMLDNRICRLKAERRRIVADLAEGEKP